MNLNQISIASYSFHGLLEAGMMDIFGYLESVRYRYQVGWADIWNGFLHHDYSDDFLKKIRCGLDERDLKLASLCCDWAHPWMDTPEEREKNYQEALGCLKAAEILGAKTVRFDFGVWTRDVTEEQWDYVAMRFREYCQRGENAGFKVGPENHWGASRRLAVQKELCARVDSPAYGMLLHLGNWDLEEGETLEGNDLAAVPMAAHTHVCYEHAHVATQCLPPLRQAGYTGIWGLEHHTGTNEYIKVQRQLAEIRLAEVE